MAKQKLSKACEMRLEEIASMAETLDGDELRAAVRDGVGDFTKRSRMSQATLEYAINGMLSGTMTPIANAISIAIQQITQPMLVAIGAMTDALKITKGNRSLRDAAAMVEGVLEGFQADMFFFNKGFFQGYPLDTKPTFANFASSRGLTAQQARAAVVNTMAERRLAKMGITDPEEIKRYKADPAFMRDNKFDEDMFDEFFREEYDYVRNAIRGKTGEYIRFPTKVTVALDEYGKARFRRMKIAQMASVKAREDASKGLGNYRDLYNKYRKDALGGLQTDNPAREELLALEKRVGKVFGANEADLKPFSDIKEFTLQNTFQSPLVGGARAVQKLQKEYTFLNYMIPFIKTPWNILKEGVSYTPGLGLVARSSYLTTDSLGRPVIEKLPMDELIPRQMLGLSMFAGVYAMFENGMITGAPKDGQEAMEWRANGIQPFSVKIGDTWVPYQRIEPIATPLGLAADLFRLGDEYFNDPNPDKSAYEPMLDLMIGFKNHITSKSFMEGFATLIGMVSDPARAGEKFASGVLNPMVPALVNVGARAMDTEERIANNPLEALQRRIPLLRNELPADTDPLTPEGRKTQKQAAFTGFPVLDESSRNPAQVEFGRLKASAGRVTDKLKGVGLTSEQLGELRRMYAETLTPVVMAIINNPAYQKASDARKKFILEKKASEIRGRVRKRYAAQLRMTDPEIHRKMVNVVYERKGLPERMQ